MKINLIPLPQQIETLEGALNLKGGALLRSKSPALQSSLLLLSTLLQEAGIKSSLSPDGIDASAMALFELSLRDDAALGNEGYRLEITSVGLQLTAATNAGLFYGLQTLRQLLANHCALSHSLPCLKIFDCPRFAWRGVMLDVARHLFPVAFIKKLLDTAASFKFNRFHWHLTEDQGWRIEIKRYPRLTEVGAWRNETLIGHNRDTPMQFDGQPYGGFYTQEEIREVVQYAAERHIVVVPEIELPGHAQAAIAAYPHLGCSESQILVRQYWGVSNYIFNVEERTFTFLEEVLDEVFALFPSEYIHIGGDEAHKEQWLASARIRERMNELGVKSVDELQSYFITRMERFINSRGRKIIGWDEILEGGLAPNAAVMSWRDEAGGIAAAKAGHPVVMTPNQYCYLNFYQAPKESEPLAIGGDVPIDKVYQYEPVPAALSEAEGRFILGAQANLWTEYIKDAALAEYMLFPRLLALAEVVWSPKEQRGWESFLARLRAMETHLRTLGLNYETNAFK